MFAFLVLSDLTQVCVLWAFSWLLSQIKKVHLPESGPHPGPCTCGSTSHTGGHPLLSLLWFSRLARGEGIG